MDPRAVPYPQSPQYRGPAVDSRGRLAKRSLRLGAAESLLALQAEYSFFTPAALYLHGMFSDAPLIEHVAALGRDLPLYYHRFARPLFRGLEARDGDADWNAALWAVRWEDWPGLLDHLCGLTVVDPARGRVVRYGQQLFDVADPLVVDRTGLVLPGSTVLVSAFGLYGNAGIAAFVAGSDGVPALRFFPPGEDMHRFARALLVTGSNPLDARDDYLRQPPGGGG